MTACETVGDTLDTDVDRDVLVHELGIDAELDAIGYVVRGMVRHAKQATGPRIVRTDLSVRQIVDHHLSFPLNCHQSGWAAAMRAEASSRAELLS